MVINSMSVRSCVRHGVVVCGMGLTSLVMTPAVLAADTATGLSDGAQIRVNYAGIDLSTVQGASLLYGRLRAAASTVCGYYPSGGESLRDWRSSAQRQRCYQEALDRSIAAVNRPQLTALHTGNAAAFGDSVHRPGEGGSGLPVAAQ